MDFGFSSVRHTLKGAHLVVSTTIGRHLLREGSRSTQLSHITLPSMMLIELYCDSDKRQEWEKWMKKEGRNLENEPDCRCGYWERGPEVMSYYFRLLIIAAYVRLKKSSQVWFSVIGEVSEGKFAKLWLPFKGLSMGHCRLACCLIHAEDGRYTFSIHIRQAAYQYQ